MKQAQPKDLTAVSRTGGEFKVRHPLLGPKMISDAWEEAVQDPSGREGLGLLPGDARATAVETWHPAGLQQDP